jgi:hypothetical protein
MCCRSPLEVAQAETSVAELRARIAFANRRKLLEFDSLLTAAKIRKTSILLPPIVVPARCR